MARVGIFGAGWVGLVTGVCFAELGHEVVVRDVVPGEDRGASRAARCRSTRPTCPELLERNGERLTLHARRGATCRLPRSSSCASTRRRHRRATPTSRASGRVVDDLPALDGRAILVMKSTVPVGTGEKIRHGLDERGLGDIGYVSNPEFLAEGSAVRDFMHPDRIAIGAFDEEDGDAVAGLYAALDAPVVRCDVNSAEMIKLAANAALMTRISFINEIANVCEATGADVVKVAEGVGLDRRLGPHFLRAGIGYGGSLLPEGLSGAEATRLELRLPLPAARGGDRGERAAEAPGDRQAQAPPRLAARQEGRAARARVQAEHRRHARGALDRARGPAARRGRRGARLGPGRRRARPAGGVEIVGSVARRCAAPMRR